MSFFSKIKNWLGIGGVKLTLHIPPSVPRSAGVINGKISLSSKSVQEVTQVSVKIEENWSTGSKEEEVKKTFLLGEVVLISLPFTIKTGENKDIDFELPFSTINSDNDNMKEQGGGYALMGKLNSMLDNERSKYVVTGKADVKSAVLDPLDCKEIKLKF